MLKYYVVHRKDKNNVGDMSSNPLQYFLQDHEYKTIDVIDILRYDFDPNIPVIAGGGGLLANEFMDDCLKDLTVSHDKNKILEIGTEIWNQTAASNKSIRDEFFSKFNPLVAEYVNKLSNDKSPRIVWGAGHNADFNKKFKGHLVYPSWLRNFDLVGVRDFNQEYEWVPCASCMHPALREKHTIKFPVIWFEHKKQLMKSTEFGSDPIPRFINSGDNIEETIRLLGSADTIITNSYHGAYWGVLLKRKVIVVDAWSSKFNAMRHKPYFLNKGESWKNVVEKIPVYNDALDQYIEVTQQYWNKVKSLSM